MKTDITGLKKLYTSGDMIRCTLSVTGKERIISSDIKLVQKDYKRVQEGYHSNGLPGHRLSNGDYTVLTGLINDVSITGPFKGELRFKIPDDATNTSEKFNYQYDSRSWTCLGIRIIIRYMKDGQEDGLDHFYSFKNKRFVPASGPVYHQDNTEIPNPKFAMLYRVSTSTFLPGETVDIDLVYIPRTRAKVHSLSVKFVCTGYDDFKMKSKKRSSFIKALVNKNMTPGEEYEYMKSAIDRGMGNKFSLKLPENLHEDTRGGTVIETKIKTYRFSPSKLDFDDFEDFCDSVNDVFFKSWGGMKKITSFQ